MCSFYPVTLVENADILVERTPTSGCFCFLSSVSPFPGGRSSPDMDEILQRLTEVSTRQQQITEHLAARQGQTEQGLDELRTAAARRVPLPDPRCKITQLLPKMTADDDVEAFLQMFENTATQEGWESSDWAWLLAPLLTGEAQRAYFALPSEVAGRYRELKREILARLCGPVLPRLGI